MDDRGAGEEVHEDDGPLVNQGSEVSLGYSLHQSQPLDLWLWTQAMMLADCHQFLNSIGHCEGAVTVKSVMYMNV